MSEYDAHIALAVVGNIMAILFFLAPVPTIMHIVRAWSTGDKTAMPYLATLGSCMVWFVYGLPLVHPFGTPLLITNGIGVGVMVVYLTVYLYLCDRPKQRLIITIVLVVEVVCVVALATMTSTMIHERGTRRFVVGVVCCICNICMYVSPVSVVWEVIRSGSVEHMSLAVAFAMLVNAIVWTVYSLLPIDPFLLASYVLCTLFGFVQIVVYGLYYRSTQRVIATRQSAVVEISETDDVVVEISETDDVGVEVSETDDVGVEISEMDDVVVEISEMVDVGV